MTPKLHIIRTSDGVDFPLPSYVSKHHVGLLLKAAIPTVLKMDPNERALIPIGFGIGIPSGLCGQIVSLPETAKELGLIVLDAPQIVNPADRNALYVLVQNASRRQIIIHRGDAIAQLIIVPVYQVCWNEITDKTLSSTQDVSLINDQEDTPSENGTNQSAGPNKRVVKNVRERTKASNGA